MTLVALLLGGVPAARLAGILASRQASHEKAWASGWQNFFLAGFVFRLSSVALTAFLFILLVWFTIDSGDYAPGVLLFGGALLLGIGCGIRGVRWWRALQMASYERRHDH